nr:coproporphyrinogen III oxidase [Deltaproteobacteria bacterium]
MSDLFDRASKFFQELQTDICAALADLDGGQGFTSDAWQRPGGGGGVARV